MRNYLLYLVMLVIGLTYDVHTSAQQTFTPPTEGVVRVKLQREVAARISQAPLPMSNGVVTTGIKPLDRANSQAKAVSIKRCVPYSPKFEERHKAAGLDLWYEIKFDPKAMTPASARNLYKSVPGIQRAEEVRPMKLIGDGPARVVDMPKAAGTAKAEPFFNDPMLSQQWHYNNDGSLAGSMPGADINANAAWAIETGKKDVLVAIIDGAFQTDHPDLKDNVWVNEAELNGEPGVDDDGNGYVDDVYGWNFVYDSNDIYPHQHGTHVAGTVGATNNNGIGVSGVAGGSDGHGGVTMMVCQVFDSRSSLNADFGSALVYAADMGASIAQCSWGWDQSGYYEQFVLDCIDYFTANGGGDKMSGGLCIFANGNTGETGSFYPAAYEPCVAVAAMDPMLNPASYSSNGTFCDVTAPGGNVDYGTAYGVLSTLPNGQYGTMDGTSMACPHVSGIAALVLSKYGNPEFPNSTLRDQLVSSVNDFYTRNPEVEGLFGSGYIDAYKALQMGTGEAPDAVADYTLTPSQDNVLIEWTIPDADVKSVDHHIIYYSTQPFTTVDGATDLHQVTVDTKFYTSGDPIQYTLEGLRPVTTYYITIVAVSRYGDMSALSEVKSFTTNEGPKVDFSKTTLTLDVDAEQGGVGKDEFSINNTGKGILEYSLSANTVSVPASTMSNSAPSPGRVVASGKKISAFAAVSDYPVVSAEYQAEDYPKEMAWSKGIFYNVGDDAAQSTNALAQYFYVDPNVYPDGFNLTALRFGGPGDSNTPEIEIYDGAQSISTASLLTKVNYMFFAYNYDINLEEQLFFEPGTSFWVVAKYPAGQSTPLGAGFANTADIRHYSFYSGDNGQTWTQLSEVLREGNLAEDADSLTWDVYAISKNPDWSSVLSPEPISGTVRPSSSQTVTMQNDGQKMVNGNYTFNLNVNTNESENPKQKLTVNVSVSGNKPELTAAKVVDFGELLVGQEKTIAVEIANNGYGDFTGQWGSLQFPDNGIKTSSDEFEPESYITGFAARSKGTLNVTFKPASAGSKSGTITLTDANGIKFNIVVRGVASMPAEVKVDKEAIDFGYLEVGGESKTNKIVIENSGQYPLEYVFPRFSDETIDGVKAHKFGYSYESNLNGSDAFQYDGNPELANETDITSQFNDNVWQSQAVDLGFQFPFYGTNYSQIHINTRGGIAMQTIDGNIQTMIPTAEDVAGLGYVSAYACSGPLHIGANTKITYGRQDGKFTIKYKDVLAPVYGDEYTPISFHMSLVADGSIEVYYDDYDRMNTFNEGADVFIGVADIECDDPFVVTDKNASYESTLYQQITTGSAIRILAPATSMVSELSSTNGVIGVGETKEITITAKAVEGMYAGKLTNNLTILTNDPVTPSKNVVLTANIIGDGLVPVVKLDTEAVDFGEVFRTSTARRSVLLSNNGTNDLTVTAVTVDGGKVTVAEDIAKGFTVKPGYGKDIFITLPTEAEGEVTDNVRIKYQDGTEDVIAVSGTVIGCPEIAVNPDALTLTTDCGTNLSQTLTVNNAGNEPLTFSIEPNDWFDLADLETETTAEIGYQYKSKTDYDEVEYDWVDITNDPEATHQDFTYYLDKTDFYTVELPFEFPFYGKKYKTMYIYNVGFVSFTQHEDYKEFPTPPTELPTDGTFYTNIIAPYWGNHTMDVSTKNGTFYKAEDDHVIVSFIGYGNSMMLGMDFQVILYKDGSYKFQYHLQDGGVMNGVFGLAGAQDEEGEVGFQLPEQYITTGNAVEIQPVRMFTVPAGGQVEVPIEILADSLGGEYATEIAIQTNVPTKQRVTVPVQLTINGEAKPVFPESVEGEDVADFVTGFTERYYDFTVSNAGTKAFTINNAEYNDPNGTSSLMVYTTYNDMFSGQEVEGWTTWPMDYMLFQPIPIEIGREPLRMRIVVMDMGTPMDIENTVKLNITGLDETEKVIPVNIKLTEAPSLTLTPADGVTVNVKNSTELTEGSMKFSNVGKYKMTYSLRMDPTGIGETLPTPDLGGGDPDIAMLPGNVAELGKEQFMSLFSRTAEEIKPHTVFEGFPYDVPPYDCNNILYYPILDVESPQAYMIGAGNDTNNFYAATRFTAPEDGFNMSRLYFHGTIGDLQNVDFEAYVVQGGSVSEGQVIGQGKLRVEKEDPYVDPGTGQMMYVGASRTLDLDKAVYINPNDTFYVVVKYPAGKNSMAYVSQKEDAMEDGRFMAYNAQVGWYDLGADMYQAYYSSFGYFMTCVEDEPGKPWIKLLDSTAEGVLEVKEEKEVKFQFDPESAYFERGNKAVLVIKTNDPENPLVNYPITLNRNAAPDITLPEGTLTVPEAQTAEMHVTVADAENEQFTVSIDDESGIATIAGGTLTSADGATEAATVADNGITVPAGSTLDMTVKFAPDYGTAGQHTVRVTATDASGNVRTADAIYNVEFTNRVPVYEGDDEMTVYVGQTTGVIAYETVFSDPDGDQMTFAATMPDNAAASIFTSEAGFIVSGNAVGDAKLTLTATDANGGRTAKEVQVNVVPATGIGSVEAGQGISVSPNPVVDRLNVVLGEAADNVNYYVYDNAGSMVATAHAAHKAAGEAQTIDMGTCAPGVYRVKVTADGKQFNASVLKK